MRTIILAQSLHHKMSYLFDENAGNLQVWLNSAQSAQCAGAGQGCTWLNEASVRIIHLARCGLLSKS